MVNPCHSFVDGLSYEAFMRTHKKDKLIHYDCLPILMLLNVIAYLMLFAALANAVCLHDAYFVAIDFWKCFYVFMLCHGLMSNSLLIENIILHHA